MSDAADERRKKRAAGWRTEVFRGPDALARLEDDALEEWAAMSPEERAALAWQLSVEQYGGEDARAVESRLPRSLTALNVADARYLLVGGHAVGIYGRPQDLADVDVLERQARYH